MSVVDGGLCLRAGDGRKTFRSQSGAVLGMTGDFCANMNHRFSRDGNVSQHATRADLRLEFQARYDSIIGSWRLLGNLALTFWKYRGLTESP